MSVVIVYAHPNPQSYTNAVLRSLIRGLEAAGREYEVIDLYQSRFNPVLVVDETRRRRDLIHDPETAGFREALARADHVVHVYPVWWGGFPAILKGFLDRTYASGFAYSFQNRGPRAVFPQGLMAPRKASFFYTLDSPRVVALLDPGWFSNLFSVFWYCGYRKVRRRYLPRLKLTTLEQRVRWLKKVERWGSEL